MKYFVGVGLMLGCQLWVGTTAYGGEPLVQQHVAKQEALHRFTFEQKQMGVSFKFVLYAKNKATANKAAQSAYKKVNELNSIFSDYDPKSKLMLLCATSKKGHPVKVSGDLLEVLLSAQVLSCKSDGAFDVTVGPMVKAWRRARHSRMLPSKRKIEMLKKRVGWQYLSINLVKGTVELQKEKMLLDLGGIAKGYAADEALKVLKKHGISRALIDAGGDIVVGDRPPGKKGWKIGIAALRKPNAPPTQFIFLENAAVATSGDAYQYLEMRGKRYSHIVNPHNGLGLTTRSSVSVIAPTGIQSDSLASAVSVLGPEKGLELIKKEKGASALIVIINSNGKRETFQSQGFAE